MSLFQGRKGKIKEVIELGNQSGCQLSTTPKRPPSGVPLKGSTRNVFPRTAYAHFLQDKKSFKEGNINVGGKCHYDIDKRRQYIGWIRREGSVAVLLISLPSWGRVLPGNLRMPDSICLWDL